jgi:hypothetical protein
MKLQLQKAPPKHRGAHAELIACAHLLREGYEVFRNISACGIADLVAWKDGKLWPVDVKSGSAGARLTQEQVQAGVVPLYVDKDDQCIFVTMVKKDAHLCDSPPHEAIDEACIVDRFSRAITIGFPQEGMSAC